MGWEESEVAFGELGLIEKLVKDFEDQRNKIVQGVPQFKKQISGWHREHPQVEF